MSTATATSTVTVNAAFFQEIKEVNQELWQTLAQVREVCQRPQAARIDCRGFAMLLGELRDQLALHFALEEAYGYFEDPAYVAPHFCERANGLRSEHRELYLGIAEISDRAEQFYRRANLPTLVGHIARQFTAFDHRLQQHEARENELIQMAYDDDFGGGD